MNADTFSKLRFFRLFTEVTDTRLLQVAQTTQTQQLKKGSFVWKEGETCRVLFFVVEGRVKIIEHSEIGKDVIVDIYSSGDAIGESSALMGGAYNTSAVCLSQCELLCVPRREMLDLLGTVPEMAFRSFRGMARRQRMLMQKIKELAAGGVEYRIAHLLLKLADRIGKQSSDGICISVVLSRQDIADLVGTTIETAIRVMSRWRKMGIVTNDKHGILIHDMDTLQDLASGATTHV